MKPAFASSKKHQAWLILLSCILFYAAQVGAQLHGVEHFFHDHGETCAQFDSIEHHKSGFLLDFVVLTIDGSFEHAVQHGYSAPSIDQYKSWYSRAPPRLSSV
jgi:hypothetical protein